MDNSPFCNHNCILAIYRRFGTKSFRHVDDSALDVSTPRRFGTILVNFPRCFGTKAFQHRMDGWMDGWIDGWMDGWADGLVVELPIKFKFFTIRVYIFENRRMSLLHILACASMQSQEHMSVWHLFFFKVEGMVILLPHGSCILAPVFVF